MNKKIHFVSGLPRAGSTLLINILHQNPNFECSKSTSGLHDVLFGIRNQYDSLIEHKAEIGGPDYNRLKRILNSTVESYYNTNKNVIIDKGRGWCSLLEMVQFMGIEPKVLVPVRNLSEVLASFEKLWRNSTGQSQWALEKEEYIKSQTVEGRCDIWASAGQPVGLAYNRIRDAIQRGYKEYMHFIEFDDLTSNPENTMRKAYSFLGQEYYPHDFKNVEQWTAEDDIGVHRIPNLHTISPEVKPLRKVAKEILGNDLYKKYQGSEFWRNSQ